jgi:predicted secreted protein
MASTAIVGPGFSLDYEDPDNPGDWIHVGQAQAISGPSESTDEIEITNQDSEGGFKEFVATLQDGGTVTFPVVGAPGDQGQDDLAALKHDRETVRWRIQFPEDENGVVYGLFFNGFVNQLGNEFPTAGFWARQTGIRVSGPVVKDVISS